MTGKALVNGRLIDGTGNSPVKPGAILITGDVIEAVGKVGEIHILKTSHTSCTRKTFCSL
jgi:hypothetical protein